MEDSNPVIRNNSILIIYDLCKLYTGLIDPFITTLSTSLFDNDLMVRKQALFVLTNLLLVKISFILGRLY